MVSTAIIFAAIIILFLFKGERPKSFSIDRRPVLNAILPLLIIIGHISQYYTYLGLKPSFWVIGQYVVGIFFFISGYGLEKKRERNGSVTLNELLSRYKKVLVPILIPVLVYCVALWWKGVPITVRLYTNITGYQLFLPYTWFIIILCIFYLFFFISARLAQSNVWFSWIISLSVLSFSVINYFLFPNSHYTNISSFTFPLGIVFCQQEKRILETLGTAKFIVFLVIFVGISFSYAIIPTAIAPVHVFAYVLCFFMLYSIIPTFSNRVVSFLNKISYELYLCQGISFLILGLPSNSLNWVQYILLSILFTTIIAWLCKSATELVFNR